MDGGLVATLVAKEALNLGIVRVDGSHKAAVLLFKEAPEELGDEWLSPLE